MQYLLKINRLEYLSRGVSRSLTVDRIAEFMIKPIVSEIGKLEFTQHKKISVCKVHFQHSTKTKMLRTNGEKFMSVFNHVHPYLSILPPKVSTSEYSSFTSQHLLSYFNAPLVKQKRYFHRLQLMKCVAQ